MHLTAWLNGQDMPKLEDIVPDASHHLCTTVTEQTNIGWSQWFRG
jgi:hypothetical protein